MKRGDARNFQDFQSWLKLFFLSTSQVLFWLTNCLFQMRSLFKMPHREKPDIMDDIFWFGIRAKSPFHLGGLSFPHVFHVSWTWHVSALCLFQPLMSSSRPSHVYLGVFASLQIPMQEPVFSGRLLPYKMLTAKKELFNSHSHFFTDLFHILQLFLVHFWNRFFPKDNYSSQSRIWWPLFLHRSKLYWCHQIQFYWFETRNMDFS